MTQFIEIVKSLIDLINDLTKNQKFIVITTILVFSFVIIMCK